MVSKWYSARGDDGYTGVIGGGRVPKYDKRTEAFGTVDEASAALGLARALVQDGRLRALILEVQRDLHKLMADLATTPDAASAPIRLAAERLTWLDRTVEQQGSEITLPPEFIVPGDSRAGAALDLARAVVRRAERLVAQLTHAGGLRSDLPLVYLNRLSSLLFLMARAADRAEGVEQFTLAREDLHPDTPGD
jgi:cob(I)alamin adenosyltransferase